jgi:CheY-like chemotaxis protein
MLNKTMVVNDNELLTMIAEMMIKSANFAQETIKANDGLEAIQYFDELINQASNPNSSAPEFLFLDLHMPNMDGWEFLEAFSEKYSKHFPDLKIAIMSASVEMKEKQMLRKYPMVVEIIDTPINEEVLNNIKIKNFPLKEKAA